MHGVRSLCAAKGSDPIPDMLIHAWRGSTVEPSPCSAAVRAARVSRAWLDSTDSLFDHFHVRPRIAWMCRPRSTPTKAGRRSDRLHGLSKAGWGPVRGREPHGCGDRAYMDVLAASP